MPGNGADNDTDDALNCPCTNDGLLVTARVCVGDWHHALSIDWLRTRVHESHWPATLDAWIGAPVTMPNLNAAAPEEKTCGYVARLHADASGVVIRAVIDQHVRDFRVVATMMQQLVPCITVLGEDKPPRLEFALERESGARGATGIVVLSTTHNASHLCATLYVEGAAESARRLHGTLGSLPDSTLPALAWARIAVFAGPFYRHMERRHLRVGDAWQWRALAVAFLPQWVHAAEAEWLRLHTESR